MVLIKFIGYFLIREISYFVRGILVLYLRGWLIFFVVLFNCCIIDDRFCKWFWGIVLSEIFGKILVINEFLLCLIVKLRVIVL